MENRHCACSQVFGLHHNPVCRLHGIVSEDNHLTVFAAASGDTVPEKRFVADPSPWMPITDPLTLKILGKFAEELFECAEAAANLDNQDADLADEIADVLCNRRLVAEFLAVDASRIETDAGSETVDEYGLICALGKCGAAVARCVVQGLDGTEPSTGRLNRSWLIDELDNLAAVIGPFAAQYRLDLDAIKRRMMFKRAHLLRWHQMECGQ